MSVSISIPITLSLYHIFFIIQSEFAFDSNAKQQCYNITQTNTTMYNLHFNDYALSVSYLHLYLRYDSLQCSIATIR